MSSEYRKVSIDVNPLQFMDEETGEPLENDAMLYRLKDGNYEPIGDWGEIEMSSKIDTISNSSGEIGEVEDLKNQIYTGPNVDMISSAIAPPPTYESRASPLISISSHSPNSRTGKPLLTNSELRTTRRRPRRGRRVSMYRSRRIRPRHSSQNIRPPGRRQRRELFRRRRTRGGSK
jgi:hypothetical protein